MSQVESLLVIKFAAFVTLFGHFPARHHFTFSPFTLISSHYKNCIPGQGVNLYIAQMSQLMYLVDHKHKYISTRYRYFLLEL